MSEGLPGRVQVARLAARGADIVSSTPIASLKRLAAVLANDEGVVSSELSFGLDGRSRVMVRGKAQATVQATCQRCLGAVPIGLEAEFLLVIVDEEGLRGLGDEEDAVVSEAGQVSLAGLVEDELMLALPIVPMHEDRTACGTAVMTTK
jgi:uncharacterized protein